MNLKILKTLTTIVVILLIFSVIGFFSLPVGIAYTPDPLNPSIKVGHATPGVTCLALFVGLSVLLVFILLPKLFAEIEKERDFKIQ